MFLNERCSTSDGASDPPGVRMGLLPKTQSAVISSAGPGSSWIRMMAAVVSAERSADCSGYWYVTSFRSTSTQLAASVHFPGGGMSLGDAIIFPMPASSVVETTGSQTRNASIWPVLSSWVMVPAEAYTR